MVKKNSTMPNTWKHVTESGYARDKLVGLAKSNGQNINNNTSTFIPPGLTALKHKCVSFDNTLCSHATEEQSSKTYIFEPSLVKHPVNLTLKPERYEEFPTASEESCSQFKCEKQDRGHLRGTFQDHLEDNGNKRKTYESIKKHATTSKSQDKQIADQHLLGYDWIAALLDNDSTLMNESESFFDDLKLFRKSHKLDCCNDNYKNEPYSLIEFEPEPVVDALTKSKLQPYLVNERLFTEQLKSGLIETENKKCQNLNEPRFVRVSIPRSALQKPSRPKPHRRGSFDAHDSCALMDHCLLGWENTRPVMMPSAQPIDIHSEVKSILKSSVTQTLAEAEALANKKGSLPSLSRWRQQYMNTAANFPARESLSSLKCGTKSGQLKTVTDKLLDSTYHMMYEMEREKGGRAKSSG